MTLVGISKSYNALINPELICSSEIRSIAELAVQTSFYYFITNSDERCFRFIDNNRTVSRCSIEKVDELGRVNINKAHSSIINVDLSEDAYAKVNELVANGFENNIENAMARCMAIVSAINDGLSLGCQIKPKPPDTIKFNCLPASSLSQEKIRYKRIYEGIDTPYEWLR